MYLLAPISTRNQFGTLLNERGLVGQAVEVGTHRAEFACILLSRWMGKMLHCIDPWDIPEGYEEQNLKLALRDLEVGRDGDYRVAREELGYLYNGRFKTHRYTSMRAVKGFRNESLDFIYIDGDHRYEYVRDDITLWWDKLVRGGILAGHDILTPEQCDLEESSNIQRAVDEFARLHGLDVWLVAEEKNSPFSFFMVKP